MAARAKMFSLLGLRRGDPCGRPNMVTQIQKTKRLPEWDVGDLCPLGYAAPYMMNQI